VPSLVAHDAKIDWEDAPTKYGAPDEMSRGIKTRMLAQGQGGFYVRDARFPAGKRVDAHSHDHSEFLYVLEGSCTMDDGNQLSAGDAIVLVANEPYGFTCCPTACGS
jgi:quercetin dioxygenase-like cupin family protein